MDLLKEMEDQIIAGNGSQVGELAQSALDQGMGADTILSDGLFAGMIVVSELFREEDIFVPQVLLAAKAMQAGITVLQPVLERTGQSRNLGKIVLGTVKGDVHNLGKKLVNVMLNGAGFEVIDLGENVSPERFVEVARSEKPQLIGMSALLTTTMPYLAQTIEALEQAGLKKQIRTMIGGACVTQEYADQIGADAYGENAGEAVEKAMRLLEIG